MDAGCTFSISGFDSADTACTGSISAISTDHTASTRSTKYYQVPYYLIVPVDILSNTWYLQYERSMNCRTSKTPPGALLFCRPKKTRRGVYSVAGTERVLKMYFGAVCPRGRCKKKRIRTTHLSHTRHQHGSSCWSCRNLAAPTRLPEPIEAS